MFMNKITVFSSTELYKMASGQVVIGKDADGSDRLYMSTQTFRTLIHKSHDDSEKEKK